MDKTVGELRNEIRLAVDRFERPDSAGFTKESLAAICAAVDYEIDHDSYPSKATMRAGIRGSIDGLESAEDDADERAFRKAELQTIAATLRDP